MRWASLLRLYPRRWRDRYEDEMSAVLEEGAPSLRDGLDLLRGAIETRLFAASTDEPRHALRGDMMGEVLDHPVPSKSSVVAAALLLLLPATFLLSVTLKYGLGHDSLFDSLEGVWTFRPIEYATVLSPLAALTLSAAPALRATFERDGRSVKAALVVRAEALRIVVAAVSAGMLLLFFVYFLTENF